MDKLLVKGTNKIDRHKRIVLLLIPVIFLLMGIGLYKFMQSSVQQDNENEQLAIRQVEQVIHRSVRLYNPGYSVDERPFRVTDGTNIYNVYEDFENDQWQVVSVVKSGTLIYDDSKGGK